MSAFFLFSLIIFLLYAPNTKLSFYLPSELPVDTVDFIHKPTYLIRTYTPKRIVVS